MFLLEEKVMNSIAVIIFEKISLETAKKMGFEKLEFNMETTFIEICRLVLQKLIIAIDEKEGHPEKIFVEIENIMKTFSKKNSGSMPVLSLFGMVDLPYSRYENKQTHKAKSINHIDYKEPDRTSPNVKKIILKQTPYTNFKESTDTLYNLKRINISESGLKDISREICEEHGEWFRNMIKEKNINSKEKSLKKQADRIVISNDGGRIKLIQSEKNTGRNAKKNAEWKEVKMGETYEIDENGNKSDNIFAYGLINKKWEKIEPFLKYSVNAFGISDCKQFETLSDCGNGIKEMYLRNFGEPDNKKYFDSADFYHCAEHLCEAAKIVHMNSNCQDKLSPEANSWYEKHKDILYSQSGEELVRIFNLEAEINTDFAKIKDKVSTYFDNNYKRMNFPILVENKLPIGSGVMEAKIRTANNKRFKGNNIYWREDNAENLLLLKCTLENNCFEQWWEFRNKNLSHWNCVYDMKFNHMSSKN
ncbi:MAG TPA: hypothetical protein PLQ81_01760 [bacterium]|nr:hypothetical protein [bacterium]